MIADSRIPHAELWERFALDRSNVELRNRLAEIYLPLVEAIAGRIWSRLPEGVEIDDLVSDGCLGLMRAIEGFDMSRGNKFETYALLPIRGAMLDGLRAMDWVPRLVRARASQLAATIAELDRELGQRPSLDQLAEYLCLPTTEVERMIMAANSAHLTSLHKVWFETDSLKPITDEHLLVDTKAEDPERRQREHDVWRDVLRGCDRVERLLLVLYYREGLTMKEIGETVDLSESRISQVHSKLMDRLRKRINRFEAFELVS